MSNFLEDILGGEADVVAGVVDGFSRQVNRLVPAAIQRQQSQLEQVQQPNKTTSTQTPFTVVRLDLRTDALYDGKGITQNVAGDFLIFRRQGSNYAAALKLTFPTGEIAILRPGTVLRIAFDTFVVEALNSQYGANWNDNDNVYAILLVAKAPYELDEPSFDVPQEYGWRQLTANANNNQYLVKGVKKIAVVVNYVVIPTTLTITLETALTDEGDQYDIPSFTATYDAGGALGRYVIPVDVEAFQTILPYVVNEAGGAPTVTTVYAIE